MALILDTGPVYALLDRDDLDHAASRQLIESAVEPLVIPAPVLVEVDYLVRIRLHAGVMISFLDDVVENAYSIEELRAEDYRRVRELCDLYSDSDIGFVDDAV